MCFISGYDRYKRSEVVPDAKRVVKRGIGLKDIAMVLLLLNVASQVFVVVITVVLGRIGMIRKGFMQKMRRQGRKAQYKQQERGYVSFGLLHKAKVQNALK